VVKKTILFKSDERKNIIEVAEFLHQLADKIEGGKVVLRRGVDEVKLNLPKTVDFEIEAEEKPKKRGKKQSIEIEIEWYEGESGDSVTLG
jgi:amphi-Trp domain-containing protein